MSKKIQITMPADLKQELEEMATELGLSQNQLTVMSLRSLVANYKAKGSFIFADLLNPDHRFEGGKNK